MKKILYILSAFIFILPCSLTASAETGILSPRSGDTAILISAVLVVIYIALFVFIRRRRK